MGVLRGLGYLIVTAVLTGACAGDGAAHSSAPDGGSPLAIERCAAAEGAPAAPSDIAQTLELINAMPHPLSLPCLIEALARPLAIHATRSVFSNQPASGARSPRMFLFFDGFVMSVVPTGMGSHLLELGEERPEHMSRKGELEFPVEGEVGPNDPFTRIMFDEQRTTCSFCHKRELPEQEGSPELGFVSQTLRPDLRDTVSLLDLAREREACDPAAEAERCALLDAVFGPEAPAEHEFDPDLETFLD